MGGGSTLQVPQIPVDPNLALEQQQAEDQLNTQLSVESQQDTSRLMALYGTRLAMAGSNSRSPLSPPPAAAARPV